MVLNSESSLAFDNASMMSSCPFDVAWGVRSFAGSDVVGVACSGAGDAAMVAAVVAATATAAGAAISCLVGIAGAGALLAIPANASG